MPEDISALAEAAVADLATGMQGPWGRGASSSAAADTSLYSEGRHPEASTARAPPPVTPLGACESGGPEASECTPGVCATAVAGGDGVGCANGIGVGGGGRAGCTCGRVCGLARASDALSSDGKGPRGSGGGAVVGGEACVPCSPRRPRGAVPEPVASEPLAPAATSAPIFPCALAAAPAVPSGPAASGEGGTAKLRVDPGVAPSGTVNETRVPDGVVAMSVSPAVAPSGTTSSNVASPQIE